MVDEQLLDYVKLSLSKKISKEKLTELLIGKGWSPSEIEEAISLVEKLPEKSKVPVPPKERPRLEPGQHSISEILIKIGVEDVEKAKRLLEPMIIPEGLDGELEEFKRLLSLKKKK